jgi:hypothetical protein
MYVVSELVLWVIALTWTLLFWLTSCSCICSWTLLRFWLVEKVELCCKMALPFCSSCSCLSSSFLLFWWPPHSGWYITKILPELEDYNNSSTCIYQYHCLHVVPDSSLSSESACFSIDSSLFSKRQILLAVRPFLLLKDMFACWKSMVLESTRSLKLVLRWEHKPCIFNEHHMECSDVVKNMLCLISCGKHVEFCI